VMILSILGRSRFLAEWVIIVANLSLQTNMRDRTYPRVGSSIPDRWRSMLIRSKLWTSNLPSSSSITPTACPVSVSNFPISRSLETGDHEYKLSSFRRSDKRLKVWNWKFDLRTYHRWLFVVYVCLFGKVGILWWEEHLVLTLMCATEFEWWFLYTTSPNP
jgi:hypothetical protein